MTPMTEADARAALARAFDLPDRYRSDPADPASWPPVVLLPSDEATPPGWSRWRVGRALVLLPTLAPHAPVSVLRRLVARVLANGTGRCPLCGAAADLSTSPERPASWTLLPLTVGVTHPEDCPALFTDDDARWFDPEGVAR